MNVVVHIPNHGVACQATETTFNPSTTKSEKGPEPKSEPPRSQITHKVVTSKFANWALCLCQIGVLGMEIQLRSQ
jgi:hypothetical protein